MATETEHLASVTWLHRGTASPDLTDLTDLAGGQDEELAADYWAQLQRLRTQRLQC